MDTPYQPTVTRLSLQELEDEAPRFNTTVQSTPEIDRFCSSTYWSVSAHLAFASYRPVWIRSSPAGYAVMAVGYRLSHGMVLEPLESVWGAASPLVGPDPQALAECFAQEFIAVHRNHIPILLTGIPVGGQLVQALFKELHEHVTLLQGPMTRCFRASLEGGMDGFYQRRSSHFRARLRRAERDVTAAGIRFQAFKHFDTYAEVLRLYQRLIRIEQASWKGLAGTGISEPSMQEFYRHMLRRLWPTQSVRCILALEGDREVGFVFGALLEGVYRGLQVSFDERYRHLSLGNVLQLQMIQQLSEEGCTLYDLGVEVAYKERWGEDVFETITLVLE